MGGDGTDAFQPTTRRLRGCEVFHQRADFGSIIEHGDQVTGYKEGFSISRVNGRQIEEVIICAVGGPFGEEAGNEVRLSVQPALRRVTKHGTGGVPEEGGHDGGTTTIYKGVIEPD